jgi:hypothetical protein
MGDMFKALAAKMKDAALATVVTLKDAAAAAVKAAYVSMKALVGRHHTVSRGGGRRLS